MKVCWYIFIGDKNMAEGWKQDIIERYYYIIYMCVVVQTIGR